MKEAKRKEEEEKVTQSSDDVTDIRRRIDERCKAYSILMGEFKSSGDLEPHTMTRGQHVGKTNYKQLWVHKYSGYDFSGTASLARRRLSLTSYGRQLEPLSRPSFLARSV